MNSDNLINVCLFINEGGFTSRVGPRNYAGSKISPLWSLFSKHKIGPKLKDWLLKLGVFWRLAMFGEKAMSH